MAKWIARVLVPAAVLSAVSVYLLTSKPAPADAPRNAPPLLIQSQGSFFIGGQSVHSDALTGSPAGPFGTFGDSNQGTVTAGQMYVQYQLPIAIGRRLPVVMINGCCLTTKSWETTPDGRMGWNEYFLRNGHGVYLVDQVERGRSGFNPTTINQVRMGNLALLNLPNITMASHELAWKLFRMGPTFGTPFVDTQFPVEAADEFYKQIVPDLGNASPTPSTTPFEVAALAKRLNGAVLMGHSQSGFFPQMAAQIEPSSVRGMITIETFCPPLTPDQVAKLATVPSLYVWGDHLTDVPEFAPLGQASYQSCAEVVRQINAAGGDATTLNLREAGMVGNSHMPMLDKNNLAVADLLLRWIETHIDHPRRRR